MDVIKAPAKLNLYLKVTGISSDNYHLLKMVNASISLVDELAVSIGGTGFSLECSGEVRGVFGEDLSEAKNNILFKTYNHFCRTFDQTPGVTVKLYKNIPIGAGLGGGSSDAAALLMYLARNILGLRGSYHLNPKLIACAKSIGADVPYFLAQSSCIVEGIGELLTPVTIPVLTAYEVYVVVPDVQLSTRDVFQRFDAKGAGVVTDAHDISAAALGSLDDLSSLVLNDLLEAASNMASQIGELMQAFRSQSLLCGLTGTGSALFVLAQKGDPRAKGSITQIGAQLGCRVFPALFLNS